MPRLTAAQARRLAEPDYERTLDMILQAVQSAAFMGGQALNFADVHFCQQLNCNVPENEHPKLVQNVIADLRQLGYKAKLAFVDGTYCLRIEWYD